MGRLASFNNKVRDSDGAQAAPRFVCNDDLMTRDGLSQVDCSGYARDDSIAHATMVGAADIQAHRQFAKRARVNHSGPRADRFTEGHRCATVQQAERLCVSVHGHCRDDALGRLFENHDSEFVVEGSKFDCPWRVRHELSLVNVHQAKGRTS